MKEITAEDKDRVLKWFYEADVNGNEMPQDVLPERSQEICAILFKCNSIYSYFVNSLSWNYE